MSGSVVVAASGVPVGTDAAINKEITTQWMKVQERVNEIALEAKADIKPGISIDEVLENLDSAQNPRNKKDSKASGYAKQVFHRTLRLIKTVGGIVADGASQVIGPAPQVYNVIVFVINAWEDYQSVFETLARVFDRCAACLGRLQEYTNGGMTPKLSKIACQQLELFVNVCDRSLALRRSRRARLKTFMTNTLFSENDVSDLLENMEGLVSKEQLMAAAVVYNRVSETLTNTRILVDDKAEQKKRLEAADDKGAILGALAFDKKSDHWDRVQAVPSATWEVTHQGIRKQHVPGTGEWILSDPSFQAWRQGTEDKTLLAVVGDEASGKSFLASSVIHHLRRDNSPHGSDSRQLVSFYFSDKRKANTGVDVVSKALVWQFAEIDTSYAQTAARACRRQGSVDPGDILPELLFENKELHDIKATFYIVINKLSDDGDRVDPAMVRLLQRARQTKNPAVRILFTCTSVVMNQLTKKGISCPSIFISNRNSGDVSKFIDSRMADIDVLADVEQDGVPELRAKVKDSLTKKAKGNFFKIETALNEIRSLDYVNEIDLVLDNAGNELTVQIEQEIRRLEKLRTPKELAEINEIILWIGFSQELVSAEEMTAVLRLRTGAASLRSLEERFKTKYFLFEIDNDGIVDFRSSKTLNAIPERREIVLRKRENDEGIHPSEIDVVKHCLNNVCPPRLREKLQVDWYLDQKLNNENDRIYQEDKDTGHGRIAATCFQLLTKKVDSSLTMLQDYARSNLAQHLSKADVALVDHALKLRIANNLVTLFNDENAIDNLFNIDGSTPGFPDWVYEDSAVTAIRDWLNDSAVISEIDSKSKLWATQLMDEPFQALLKASATRMAMHCFREPSSPSITLASFKFIMKVLSTTNETPTNPESPYPDEIQQAEEWSQAVLQVVKPNTNWHVQMALVFKGLEKPTLAAERCRQALSGELSHWRASHVLAQSVEDNQEAIQILEALIERMENDVLWIKDHTKELAQMVFDLGTRYWNAEQFNNATEAYLKCLVHDPTDHMAVLQIFRKYRKRGLWNDMINIVDKIESLNGSHLRLIVVELASIDFEDFHEIVFQVAMRSEQLGMLDRLYSEATQLARRSQNWGNVLILRFFHTRGLWKLPNPPIDTIEITLQSVLKFELPRVPINSHFAFFYLYESILAKIYLRKALEQHDSGNHGLAVEYVNKMSEMVPEQIPETNLICPPCFYAVRYYHRQGDSKTARQVIHNALEIALELLSDDDASNDIYAHLKIRYMCTAFGDKDNTATAMAMSMLSEHAYDVGRKAKENRHKETKEAPLDTEIGEDGNRKFDTDFTQECDCGCDYRSKNPGGVWFCKDCITVVLTSDCRHKLLQGEFMQNVCSQSHDHFYVPEWDINRLKKVPVGYVPWGDEDISMEQWKQILRKEYLEER